MFCPRKNGTKNNRTKSVVYFAAGVRCCRLKAFYFETTTTAGTPAETVMGSRLTIDGARRQDGGLYVCTAQNAYGSDTSDVELTVLEPPDSPSNILLDGVGSRTLTLSWNVDFDGNSPLTAVVVELCNETGQLPHIVFGVYIKCK